MVNSMDSTKSSPTSTAKRKKNKKQRKALLSSTRPNKLRPTRSTPIPSSVGRTVIRQHHTLHKRLSAAIGRHDDATANTLRQEITSLGGVKRYQDASLAGQGKERGGDTSGVLLTWLSSYKAKRKDAGLRMLEVGALSVDNACGRCGLFEGGIERIDLNSRHPDIKEQDFMERPLPRGKEETFDVISLSLVVNFVGQLNGRGEMLRRVGKFLRTRTLVDRTTQGRKIECNLALEPKLQEESSSDGERLLPALFLVLPAPCVNNSRYLDEERLKAIMQALEYSLVRRKMSSKLVYYLWKFNGLGEDDEQKKARAIFGKEEIKKGKNRNNFAIMLQ